MSANEGELIAQAQAGDQDAFGILVDRHALYVYNLALRVLRDQHEAENLAQEAFLRAWRGLPAYRGRAKFSTWLYRIVTNLCFNRLPGLKRELASLVPEDGDLLLAGERQTAEANLLSKEMQASLHRAIADLPASYHLLITLRYLQELSYEQIAQVTGMPLGTVKTGIHRARRLLREVLEKVEA